MATEAQTSDNPVAIEDTNNAPMVDVDPVEHSSPSADSKELVTMESLRKILKDGCFQSAAAPDAEEPDEEERLFADSTHSFLIYFDTETKERTSKLIIGIFVIFVQFVLYIVAAQSPLEEIAKNNFTIPVKVSFGRKCEEPKNLVCPPEAAKMGYCALGALLLSFFLMHSLVASARIFIKVPGRTAKIAASVILFETVFALFCAGLFAVTANEGYEAIANCVGVLFVHEMGERAYSAFEVLKLHELPKCKAKRCEWFGKTRLAALFIISIAVVFWVVMSGLVVQQARKAQIVKKYGETYYDKKFGGVFEEYEYDYDANYVYTYEADGGDGGDDAGDDAE